MNGSYLVKKSKIKYHIYFEYNLIKSTNSKVKCTLHACVLLNWVKHNVKYSFNFIEALIIIGA